MDAQSERPRALPKLIESLAERLQAIYGSPTAERILASMRAPKDTTYVVNRLAGPPAELPGEPVAGVADCRAVPPAGRARLLEHPEVGAGILYPLNPSSVVAARALEVNGTMEVLDLAAAPGGKTLILAMEMGNRGRIAAVEPIRARFHRLRANLARCHVTNVEFYQTDGRSVGRKVPGRFDRVLLDAPCSSEARIRLDDPATYRHWKPRKIRETSRKQRGLIRSAYQALKPGGEMIYCTCAFSPEENELVVGYLLQAEPSADLLSLPASATATGSSLPGLARWGDRSLDARLTACLRILPDARFDGFFLARIRKGR